MTTPVRTRVDGDLAIIGSRPPGLLSSLRELGRDREMIYFLAWRDIRVRYKQAALGISWAVLRPLLLMLVFSFIFSRVTKVPTGGVPYADFAFVGLLMWTYFSTALLGASDSLVSSSNLVSKVYFPRLALPLAALIAQLPDLVLGGVLLGVILLVTGASVSWHVVLLPLVLVLLVIVTFSIGIWLAALNVAYRDVKHAVPFIVQIGMFISPVVYPSELVPQSFRALYGVNPVAGVLELGRWSVFGSAISSLPMLLMSLVAASALLVAGVHYFRSHEHLFADVI